MAAAHRRPLNGRKPTSRDIMLCRAREARRLHPSPERCSITSGSRTGGGLERLDASHERIWTSQRSKIDRAHELLRALHLRCALRRQRHDHRRGQTGSAPCMAKQRGFATSLILVGFVAQHLTRAAACAGRLLPQRPRTAERQRKSRSAPMRKGSAEETRCRDIVFPFSPRLHERMLLPLTVRTDL